MSRLDWNGGRFHVDYETNEIYKGLRGWQREVGDYVSYYRFAYDQSYVDPTYGEATGPNGRTYFGPINTPALHVLHTESGISEMPEGFETSLDRIHVTASFDMVRRIGLTKMDIQTESYLKDRLVYDNMAFRIQNIQILGQIQRRDIIVTIDGVQLKPEDMVNDIQFAAFTNIPAAYPLDYKPKEVNLQARNKQLGQVVPRLHGPEPE